VVIIIQHKNVSKKPNEKFEKNIKIFSGLRETTSPPAALPNNASLYLRKDSSSASYLNQMFRIILTIVCFLLKKER
jgi:hypothetical protein